MALPQNCPLCGSGPQRQAVVTAHVYGDVKRERAFFHCTACDVRYMFPGLTPAEEAHFYAAEFERFMAGRSGAAGGWANLEEHVRANETTRVRRMRYLAPCLRPGAEILEIGCSSGFMLYPLIESGHHCTGVEPSGVFSAGLKARGLRVHASLQELTDSGAPARFDVVMHFFVLEHIAQPLAFLRAQLALLAEGGRIVFEIPNAADPLYSLYDIAAFERFYWSVAHPWYFSEASLRHLLERLGRPYEIRREQRYDLSNHLIWARDGRPGGMGRFTAELGPEIEEAYKQALVQAGRCDTLVGIIRHE